MWDLELLHAKSMEGGILNEEEEAACCSVEAIPEGELERSREDLLWRDALDGDELLETSDYVVIGENAALVLAIVAFGDEAALVECYHHVGTSDPFAPQRPCEGHLQCVGRWLLERRLQCSCNLLMSRKYSCGEDYYILDSIHSLLGDIMISSGHRGGSQTCMVGEGNLGTDRRAAEMASRSVPTHWARPLTTTCGVYRVSRCSAST